MKRSKTSIRRGYIKSNVSRRQKTKKFIVAGLLLILVSFGVRGQVRSNLQTLYRMGSYERTLPNNEKQSISNESPSIQIQMLGRDSLGTFYWNTEANFKVEGSKHLTTNASIQILRGVKFSKKSYLEGIVGFNGGTNGGSNFYFAGLHHPLKVGKVVLLPVFLYSYKDGDEQANFRFLTAYNTSFINGKLSVFGFVNVWNRDLFAGTPFEKNRGGFQTSPQIFWSLNKQIGVGGQIDISYHRYTPDNRIVVLPSVAMRWKML